MGTLMGLGLLRMEIMGTEALILPVFILPIRRMEVADDDAGNSLSFSL